jgi:glutaredoxin
MNLVEVFVEDNCSACESVLEILERLSGELPLVRRIYHRDADREEFDLRGVAILPATFINHQLAFYGEFSTRDFHRQLLKLRIKS